MSKYYHDTVFCFSKSTIINSVKELWLIFKDGGKFARAGCLNQKLAQQYQELIKSKD